MNRIQDILHIGFNINPDNIALADTSNNRITYSELLAKTAIVQDILNTTEIGKGTRVGIISQKTINATISIFGILKSGAAYVPIDAESPIERMAFIIKNAKLKALIIESSLVEHLQPYLKSYTIVNNYPLNGLVLIIDEAQQKYQVHQPDNLAIILYTSGSTGTPKGVMVTHENVLSFIKWSNDLLDISHKDVFSSIAPYHFDLSTFDLYVSMMNGASLVLIDAPTARNPRMISSLIEQRKISILYATPSLLKLMLRFGKIERFDHTSIKQVLFAGEIFNIESFIALKEKWHTADFYNLYGPTETNVVTYYKVPSAVDAQQVFPIGITCPYATSKLYDNKNTTSAIKEGELLISGSSVSPGYWNNSAKNSAAFIKDDAHKIWYKTGDWVRLDASGNYVFIGRKDRMIKKNGYRIELAEIEAALQKHSSIAEAAIIAKEHDGKIEISAFYQLEEIQNEALQILQLNEHCFKFIPKYMLPDRFVCLSSIPKTSTHKVDYQRLLKL